MWKKSIQNHESKLNENSKALYRDLVEEKIIPEIKEDGDSDLTTEEIDLVGSHLDKEIEDLNHSIENENCTQRGINKVKRELDFVLMALNIRKIVARRAVYYQIHLKKLISIK